MNKQEHAIGAFGIILGCLYFQELKFTETEMINNAIMASGILLGSYLPDLDADYSYFRYNIPVLANIYANVQESTKNTKAYKFFKHRGILLHSVWTIIFMIITSFFMSLIFNKFKTGKPFLSKIEIEFFFIGVILGTLGYHILDMMTRNGLKYFYPWHYTITKYTFLKPIKFLRTKKKRKKSS